MTPKFKAGDYLYTKNGRYQQNRRYVKEIDIKNHNYTIVFIYEDRRTYENTLMFDYVESEYELETKLHAVLR